MTMQPVLIAGKWREAKPSGSFRAENPATQTAIAEEYPISGWEDIDAALDAAARAAIALQGTSPEVIARFLEQYAANIERDREPLVEMAHLETALPAKPRLADVELPRTVSQLRSAARAAREQSWRLPTIDTQLNIRSCHAPIGPVLVFGPNNFPFAFNSIAGGDFVAAIATGCPVVAKANTSHPGTTRLLAICAQQASEAAALPTGTIQLLYRTSHADGARAVADPRIGATGYTGSRQAGLLLKSAADAAGKPIYLELSSINPVLILPGAINTRGEALADEFTGSCLMGTGQFCTNPGLVILLAGPETDAFLKTLVERFQAAPVGTLLSRGVAKSLGASIDALQAAGAKVLTGGTSGGGRGYSFANTLLSISAAKFLSDPEKFQIEAFGNSSLLVIAESAAQTADLLASLEGNLTGCIYSDPTGSDDELYAQFEPLLRQKVGRLLNDKMPTGVAVSPAMNHGGPYPSTGHPGFTAVGIPAALRRFTRLACYDNVRDDRLPEVLRNHNSPGVWRFVDGLWTQGDVARSG
jgi:NADP-dependent aldehyde dehydrogenase